MEHIEDERKPFNKEKIRKSNIGEALEKKLSQLYPANSRINDTYKNFDLTILTNELGEAVTLYLGKRQENGKIKGEVFYRKIKKRIDNKIVESHWDNQGKVSGV